MSDRNKIPSKGQISSEESNPLECGFSAQPADNGGWIINTAASSRELLPANTGAFSNPDDMVRYIAEKLGVEL